MGLPRPDFHYHIPRLNVWFALSSLALLAVSLWMIADDYLREWKVYQRKFFRLEHAKAGADLKRLLEEQEQSGARARLEELRGELTNARSGLETRKGDFAKIDHTLDRIRSQFEFENQEHQFRKSELETFLYYLDHYREKGDTERAQSYKDKIDTLEPEVARRKKTVDDLKYEEATELQKRHEISSSADTLEKEIKALEKEQKLITDRAKEVSPGFTGAVRNLPVLDFVIPSIKIQQKVLPQFHEEMHFTTVPRVDRCMTCHIAIDRPGYETRERRFPQTLEELGQHLQGRRKPDDDQAAREFEAEIDSFKARKVELLRAGPNAPASEILAKLAEEFPETFDRLVSEMLDDQVRTYKEFVEPVLREEVRAIARSKEEEHELATVLSTHPRLDLYLSSSSPHPVDGYGCTICHGGQGRSMAFLSAVHSPESTRQEEHWTKRYGQEHMLWDSPMVPSSYVSSSCVKCHTDQVRIPGADEWNRGKELFERYGCFGCHKVEGIEITPIERKVGPDLRKISQKLNAKWTYHWIDDPSSFRPKTRMPKFFGLSNNSSPEDEGRTNIEIHGIVQYLFAHSLSEAVPEPSVAGDPSRGEQVVKTRGCFGCHVTEDPQDAGTILTSFGPNLSSTGSKTTTAWLTKWIQDPKAYNPHTLMPDLRLSDQEAADAAAFLATRRNQEFDRKLRDVPPVEPRLREQMIRDLLGKTYRSTLVEKSFDDLVRNEIWKQHLAIVLERTEKDLSILLSPRAGETIPMARGTLESFSLRLGRLPRTQDDKEMRRKLEEIAQGLKDRSPLEASSIDEAARRVAPELSRELAAVNRLDPVPSQDLYLGQQMIGHYGCFGCHAIEGFAKARRVAPDLTGPDAIATKFMKKFDFGVLEKDLQHARHAWLGQKLRDPRGFDKGKTRKPEDKLKMPKFNLEESEIHALVTFLLGLTNEKITREVKPVPSAARQERESGERIVWDRNCMGCHQFNLEKITVRREPLEAGGPQEELVLRGMTEVDTQDMHLFTLWHKVPELGSEGLIGSPVDLRTLGTILRREPARGADGAIAIAYHMMQEAGRDPAKLDALDLARELGERRPYLPPNLYREGEKVQPSWLFRFLKNPETIRPSVEVQMPTFGFTDAEAETLSRYFARTAGQLYPFEEMPELDPTAKKNFQKAHPQLWAGVDSFLRSSGHGNCVSCHAAGGASAQGPKESWGPDLSLVRERFRPDWLRPWLKDPASLLPGTKMPSPSWGDYKDLLPGAAEDQIEAVTLHLLHELKTGSP